MWLAYLCSILVGLARSAVPPSSITPNSQNYFIDPGAEVPNGDYANNKVVSVGETMPLQWVTVYDAYEISLWQVLSDYHIGLRRLSLYNYTGGDGGQGHVSGQWRNWTLESSVVDESPVFLFWGVPDDDTEPSFASHFFNITNRGAASDPPSTTTDGSSASTSSSSTVTATLKPSESLDTHTGILNPTAVASTGLSTSTPTAIANGTNKVDSTGNQLSLELGLGLGLGIPFLLIVVAVIICIVDKKRKSSQAETESTALHDEMLPDEMTEQKSRPVSSFVSTFTRRPASSLISAFTHRSESSPLSPNVISPCDVPSACPVSSRPISELRGSEIFELPANEPKAELP